MNLIARNCLHRLPAVVTALLVLMVAVPAYAHHPMGGVTPSSFGEGLLSGIGHPIIGLDHLAFVLGIGVAASFLKRGLAMPAFFRKRRRGSGFIFGFLVGDYLSS